MQELFDLLLEKHREIVQVRGEVEALREKVRGRQLGWLVACALMIGGGLAIVLLHLLTAAIGTNLQTDRIWTDSAKACARGRSKVSHCPTYPRFPSQKNSLRTT